MKQKISGLYPNFRYTAPTYSLILGNRSSETRTWPSISRCSRLIRAMFQCKNCSQPSPPLKISTSQFSAARLAFGLCSERAMMRQAQYRKIVDSDSLSFIQVCRCFFAHLIPPSWGVFCLSENVSLGSGQDF